MKFAIEQGYISVISPRLTYMCGLFSGSPKLARAAARYPFIIFRSEEEKVPWVITHERIHFRQQVETLFIGSLVLLFLETLYALLILRKGFKETYFWRSGEQEAYRNQQDPTYLATRPLWAQFPYLTDKKTFTIGRPGEVVYVNDDVS